MDVTFTFRHVEPSEGVKNYTTEKLGRLQKFLHSAGTADAVFSMERHLFTADIAVHGEGMRLSGAHESEDMYASIDLAIDKIDRQLRDWKASQNDKKKHAGGLAQMNGKR